MFCITDVLRGCNSSNIQITSNKREGGLTTIEFLLRGDDGTTMAGKRSFHSAARFTGLADFEDELWAGPLYECPNPAPASRLLFTLGMLALSVPISFWMAHCIDTAPASVAYILTVVTTAKLLGTRAALVMSGVCALAYNFFVVAPALAFTAPAPKELILFAFYILLSLYVPWLKRRKI